MLDQLVMIQGVRDPVVVGVAALVAPRREHPGGALPESVSVQRHTGANTRAAGAGVPEAHISLVGGRVHVLLAPSRRGA